MAPARFALLLATFYLALLADTVGGPQLAIGRACPDWTALVLSVWLLHTRTAWAPLMAGGLGLLVDLAAGGRVGPGIAAFALAGYALPQLAAKLPSRMVLVEALVVGVTTLGVVLVLVATAYVAADLPERPSAALVHALTTAVYTGLAAIPILMLQNWLRSSSVRSSWRYAG